jgi:DNA-binding NarL/FixJ family response regulator
MKNILLIDDHPLILDAYSTILEKHFCVNAINVTAVYSLQTAYEIIFSEEQALDFYDIIVCDVSMPSYLEMKIKDGIDLAILIRSKFPKIKILMITGFKNPVILYNIYEKINPEGLLVKGNIKEMELIESIQAINSGTNYYSKSAEHAIKNISTFDWCKDYINRNIIFLISKGNKTNAIAAQLCVSESTIEKRKVLIKENLGIDRGSDSDLLNEARKNNIL